MMDSKEKIIKDFIDQIVCEVGWRERTVVLNKEKIKKAQTETEKMLIEIDHLNAAQKDIETLL